MHWRTPRAFVTLKDGPSYVDYGGGSTTPVAPYRPQPAIYMPTVSMPSSLHPAPAPYPGSTFATQRAPEVRVNIVQGAAQKSYPPFPMARPAVKTYQPLPFPYGVAAAAVPVPTPRAPAPEPKISMDQAIGIATQFVNQTSWSHGAKDPKKIREANDLIRQATDINKAITSPGYTVQEQKGRYVVVPTKAEARVSIPQDTGFHRSWWRTEETQTVSVGVDPSKLPNLQRILLNEAMARVAPLTGRAAPKLPDIARPLSIARSQ